MGLVHKLLLVILPVLGILTAVLQPAWKDLRILASVGQPLNNDRCTPIPELEACEDAWILQRKGLAYLPCSTRLQRVAWLPAILHLNASALPAVSKDHLALLDLKTTPYQTQRLNIVGAPPIVTDELHLHGIDIYEDPADSEHLTIFINSHRTPRLRSESEKTGADSVIEVLETRVGEKDVQWVKTVQHPLIRTPNNIVAMGQRTFYFTNDHRRKAHWTRAFGLIKSETSDIIYCDASGDVPYCIVAADGVDHPNGIAKGHGNILYSASSGGQVLSVWERQSGDNSLILLDTIIVPRIMDNLHVRPSDGAIFVAAFPKPLDLVHMWETSGLGPGNPVSPSEVWKVTNETSDAKFYGSKYRVERVFIDDGHIASGVTTSAPWGKKLLLTGPWSEAVNICEIE